MKPTFEQLKTDILCDIYMEGVNMTGEYQGCWIRFKDIERIVDAHFKRITDEADN